MNFVGFIHFKVSLYNLLSVNIYYFTKLNKYFESWKINLEYLQSNNIIFLLDYNIIVILSYSLRRK